MNNHAHALLILKAWGVENPQDKTEALKLLKQIIPKPFELNESIDASNNRVDYWVSYNGVIYTDIGRHPSFKALIYAAGRQYPEGVQRACQLPKHCTNPEYAT